MMAKVKACANSNGRRIFAREEMMAVINMLMIIAADDGDCIRCHVNCGSRTRPFDSRDDD